jgi:hypothetical protein
MDKSKIMKPEKHILIFSHGFGVRKDDLGLLTDIAAAVPEVESIFFDYYDFDEKNNILTTCSFSQQVKKLREVISKTQEINPGAVIDLICHSQGGIIAALAQPIGIRKTIMLAPPFDVDIERTLKRYATKPGATINPDGISKIPSSSGLTRIIPREYWIERKAIKPFEIYNKLADQTELIIIEAKQDKLLPKVDLTGLSSKIKLMPLDGDHDFSGEDRKNLLNVLRDCIISA